jgi:hypothetical protein
MTGSASLVTNHQTLAYCRVSPDQSVSPDLGRRIYVHEYSFANLALKEADAAEIVIFAAFVDKSGEDDA